MVKKQKKRYEQWQLNRTISHEAAHALDLRAGGGFKFLSETRNKEVYKFIKYTNLDILKEMPKFMMGDYGGFSKMCPNLKITFPYFDPAFIKDCIKENKSSVCNITELFADMYGFFLACDSNLNFPNDPTLKAKFEEFLQILKKYNLL
jgi:hypothetical protein